MGILRLLLALAVVITHSSTTHLQGIALPGDVAVQAFFIISGFYIALILHRKYNFAGGNKLFYQQRYLRLAPMYWIAVLSTIGAGLFYSILGNHPAGKFSTWTQYGGHLSFGSLSILGITQASMMGLDSLMFCAFSGHPLSLHLTPNWLSEPLPAVRFMLVPPAWSLSLELLFYTTAPFLVRRNIRFLLVLIAFTFGLRIIAGSAFGLSLDPWRNRFFPFEAGLFLLGSVAYRFLSPAEGLIRRYWSIRVGLTIALCFAVFAYGWIPLPEIVRHWGFLTLVLVSVPLLFAATQSDAKDRCLGEISYPLYLLHQVTLFSLEPVLRRVSGITSDIVTLLLTLAVAAVAYALIERPFESWRARRYLRAS